MRHRILTVILSIVIPASAAAQDHCAGTLPEFLQPGASGIWLPGRYFDLHNEYDTPLWRMSERGMPVQWVPSPWIVEQFRPGSLPVRDFLPVDRPGVQGTMEWIRGQQQRSVVVQPTVNGMRRVDFRPGGKQGSSAFSISIRSY